MTTSIPRFAPLGDMALSFDGAGTIAQAVLPAALIPAASNGGEAFSLTFWMTAPPLPDAAPAPDGGSGQAAAPGTAPQSVVEVFGPSGPLAVWSIDEDFQLTFTLGGAATASPPAVELGPYVGRWVFVATTYTPPAGTGDHGEVALSVSDGGPQPVAAQAALATTINPVSEDRTLTLGNTAAAGQTGLKPYLGALTRVRLWSTSLTPDQAALAMYDYPIGPQAYRAAPLVGDWRISEGYGTTAFDYAGSAGEQFAPRYTPPPGNHLRLGGGTVETEPAWIVADLTSLVTMAVGVPTSAPGAPLPQPGGIPAPSLPAAQR